MDVYMNPAEHPPEFIFQMYCRGESCSAVRELIEKHLEGCAECRMNVVRTVFEHVGCEKRERH
jgi:hypothetical protein